MEPLYLLLLAGIITTVLIPIGIPFLKKLKFGQFVREDGPQTHLYKAGTPTMGGILFMLVIVIISGVVGINAPEIIPILLVSMGFGIIGFIDDYIKVVKKRSLGFKAYQKMAAQLVITVAYCGYLLVTVSQATSIIVPFTNAYYLELSWLYVPFMIVFMLGTVNAVNLTDGIDGLSTSITIAVLVFFLIVSGDLGYEIAPILAISIGALFGFLVYNSHPAKLFMGDTGSLALGGLVAAVALYTKLPLIIILVGFVYLAEAISVILQVAYYKKTKKRLFKMAPIHHHFEMIGLKETKIVYIFTILTIFLSIISYIGLKNFL